MSFMRQVNTCGGCNHYGGNVTAQGKRREFRKPKACPLTAAGCASSAVSAADRHRLESPCALRTSACTQLLRDSVFETLVCGVSLPIQDLPFMRRVAFG